MPLLYLPFLEKLINNKAVYLQEIVCGNDEEGNFWLRAGE
jgi:hypothetical protein